jgi:hypothetical protein
MDTDFIHVNRVENKILAKLLHNTELALGCPANFDVCPSLNKISLKKTVVFLYFMAKMFSEAPL